MKERLICIFVLLSVCIAHFAPAHAEEVRLYDNNRIYGTINSIEDNGQSIGVLLPTGEEKTIPMTDIIEINFLGRSPLLIQSGTQEFRFINGSAVLGQLIRNQGNNVVAQSAIVGENMQFDLSRLKGFVSMPMSEYGGRKASELVESAGSDETMLQDLVIDRRGSEYAGVVRRLSRTHIDLDIDALLQVRPIKIMYVRGVRLADAARDKEKKWQGEVIAHLRCRDGSIIKGNIEKIRLNKWHVRPNWDKKSALELKLDEISMMQIQGGQVQYLSQLRPTQIEENTIIAPPQPYRMNRNSRRNKISIAGRRYPWGIGVHANSSLTFDVNGQYKTFSSDIGIDTTMGDRGSVIFKVLGDGKELYKSPVIRGSDEKVRKIDVPIKGVRQLTLTVEDAGDLDLSDVANWGSARVLRFSPDNSASESGKENENISPEEQPKEGQS